MKQRMKYAFAAMNEKFANDIANWRYDDIYSFYDMAADAHDLMDTKNWRDVIKAVLAEDAELVGWAAFHTENDEFWLSLYLRPDLTGKGLGEGFVSACVNYAISRYELTRQTIRLRVALFNQRAVKVYKRVGFIETSKIIRDTHIGPVDFIEMEKHVAREPVQFWPLPPINMNRLSPPATRNSVHSATPWDETHYTVMLEKQ